MAIAWISGIENTSGATYTMWVEGVPTTGGHTGKSSSYGDDKDWGSEKVPVPNNSNWLISDCAIPFFDQNKGSRRYLQGPNGTVYFDVTGLADHSGDGIMCYDAKSGAALGEPVPVGPSNDDTAGTTFTISIMPPTAPGGGVNFVYQGSTKGLSGGVEAFEKAAAALAPIVTPILQSADA